MFPLSLRIRNLIPNIIINKNWAHLNLNSNSLNYIHYVWKRAKCIIFLNTENLIDGKESVKNTHSGNETRNEAPDGGFTLKLKEILLLKLSPIECYFKVTQKRTTDVWSFSSVEISDVCGTIKPVFFQEIPYRSDASKIFFLRSLSLSQQNL